MHSETCGSNGVDEGRVPLWGTLKKREGRAAGLLLAREVRRAVRVYRYDAKKKKRKKETKEKERHACILAILVAAYLYFSRCARGRERSERERCASSRVPFAISRFFAIFRDFFAIFRSRSRFARARYARARSRIAHREKYRCAK